MADLGFLKGGFYDCSCSIAYMRKHAQAKGVGGHANLLCLRLPIESLFYYL